ncbi:MAG: hypothetical protein AB9866_22785 [Syntrophobacteraceae bacterium]
MSEKSADTSILKNYGKHLFILIFMLMVGYVLLYLTYRGVKQDMVKDLNARQMIHAKQAAKGIAAIPGTAWLRTVERGHGGTQAGFIRSDEIEEQVLRIVYPDRVGKAKQVIENPAKRWIGYESGAGSENTAITSRRTGLQVGLF